MSITSVQMAPNVVFPDFLRAAVDLLGIEQPTIGVELEGVFEKGALGIEQDEGALRLRITQALLDEADRIRAPTFEHGMVESGGHAAVPLRDIAWAARFTGAATLTSGVAAAAPSGARISS